MSLQSNLKNILNEIDIELHQYENYRHPDLLKQYINDRLIETLKCYNKQLDLTSEYLLRQASTRVLKALTKIKRQEDRDIIAQNMIEEKQDE